MPHAEQLSNVGVGTAKVCSQVPRTTSHPIKRSMINKGLSLDMIRHPLPWEVSLNCTKQISRPKYIVKEIADILPLQFFKILELMILKFNDNFHDPYLIWQGLTANFAYLRKEPVYNRLIISASSTTPDEKHKSFLMMARLHDENFNGTSNDQRWSTRPGWKSSEQRQRAFV
jgi:hypothetical protein